MKCKNEFYVSTEGDDKNPGTNDLPFATLERARNAVRELKEKDGSKLKSRITVFVREGTYYLAQPLVFEDQDSGTKEYPIIYSAYPGENPVISGGKLIVAHWMPFRDGIVMCSLPDELDFTQLFVDGKQQILARYPNGDSKNSSKNGYTDGAKPDKWPHTQFQFDPDKFTKKRWTKPHEAVLHIFARNYWGNLQWKIEDVDWDKQIVKLGEGGWQLNTVFQTSAATGIGEGSRFFVEGIFEELDAPGEWYLDRDDRVLYYLPSDDVDIDNAKVEVALLKRLIEFRGSKEKPVHHIKFSGFRICHPATTFLEKYNEPSLGDWSIHRGGAVFLEGSEDCVIENCVFAGVGGNAVFINNHNRRIKVCGNTFTETGDSAICLVGKSHLRPDRRSKCPFCGAEKGWSWDEPKDEYPAECLITNNLIHDIGVFGKQTAGVFISLSMKNVITHSMHPQLSPLASGYHIYNTPRAGICINDGTWGGHIIEFNDIHDTVRETGDHGPFNSWGRERFWCPQQSHGPQSHKAGDLKQDAKYTTIIRNNRFRDNRGWGIDLDDGSSNYHVYNNLCIGISIKLREGDFRTVENNIFVNPANCPGLHVGYENNRDRFVKNIIVVNTEFDNPEVDVDFKPGKGEGDIYKFIRPPHEGKWFGEMDYNLFFNNIGQFFATADGKRYNLEHWQKLGFDEHSSYADPMFINPRNGDFRVKPESPALKLGFQNFSIADYGTKNAIYYT